MNTQRRVPTLVGLALTLVLPILSLAFPRIHGLDDSGVLLSVVTDWGTVVALLLLVRFWEHQPLDSIGFRAMEWKDAGWGFGGFLLGIIAFPALGQLVEMFGLGSVNSGIRGLANLSLQTRVAIVVTAGVTEEILFRGYPIERLIQWTGRPYLAGVITYVVFVGLHLPFWGLGGTLQIGAWSLIVTWVYLQCRSLAACILMHILNDAFAFLLVPTFLSPH